MIKAVIFDMDGVLIEAKDWHFHALNRALSLFGCEITMQDHLVRFDGLPTSAKLKMLTEDGAIPRELHTFINDMKQLYTMEFVHTQCRPRFVHEYALSQLREKGYKLAVASNSIRNTVMTMMKYAHLTDYLEFFLSNEDVPKPKPAPDIYIKAIEKLSLDPKECLIVEDNEKGILAAKGSGAHLLKVDEVVDVNLDNILRRIREIESIAY